MNTHYRFLLYTVSTAPPSSTRSVPSANVTRNRPCDVRPSVTSVISDSPPCNPYRHADYPTIHKVMDATFGDALVLLSLLAA